MTGNSVVYHFHYAYLEWETDMYGFENLLYSDAARFVPDEDVFQYENCTDLKVEFLDWYSPIGITQDRR